MMRNHQPTNEQLILCGSLAGVDRAGFYSFRYAGKLIRLNAMAAHILSLCNGHNTHRRIVALIRDQQPTPRPQHGVREFLEAALRSGWIEAWTPATRAHRYLPSVTQSILEMEKEIPDVRAQ